MLDLISDIATAIGTARQPRQEPGAVGAFWSVPVPGAAAVVPHVIKYARTQSYEFETPTLIGDAKIHSIEVFENFITVAVNVKLPRGGPLQMPISIPYPNDNIRRLCTGQSAQFGRLELQISGNLLPSLRMTDDPDHPCVIRWEQPIRACLAPSGFVRRLMRWATSFEIDGLRIGPTGGELLTRGLKGKLLPSLTW